MLYGFNKYLLNELNNEKVLLVKSKYQICWISNYTRANVANFKNAKRQ